MADKTTHFGRAGEYFAMSELLLRGWNVAIPVVDVGDDVFVIDDNDKTTWRLQVKSATADDVSEEGDVVPTKATFKLSRAQLRAAQAIELFYMFMIRTGGRWRFLVIPRAELLAIRDKYVDAGGARDGRGRRPLADTAAKTDSLLFEIELRGDDPAGWGASLRGYLDCWPEALAPVEGGPGTVGASTPGG